MGTAVASEVDLGPAREIVEAMGRIEDGDLIPILQKLQEAYGYLPQPVLAWISEQTGLPASRIYGVITFYSQFHLQPRGRHTIRMCRGTACHVRGGKHIAEAIRRELGVEEGETTEDMRFTFESVMCLGTCFLAPVMMVDRDYHGRVTPQRVRSILSSYA